MKLKLPKKESFRNEMEVQSQRSEQLINFVSYLTVANPSKLCTKLSITGYVVSHILRKI